MRDPKLNTRYGSRLVPLRGISSVLLTAPSFGKFLEKNDLSTLTLTSDADVNHSMLDI